MMHPTVTIWAGHILRSLSREEAERRLAAFPPALRDRIARLRRWENRQAGILGKLLLCRALAGDLDAGLVLEQLDYSPKGRPFVRGLTGIDFNIAHSGDLVVCALSRRGRLGIDIERIRPVAVDEFQDWLPTGGWNTLTTAADPQRAFFDCWTRMESVSKAEGVGLNGRPRDIRFEGETAWLNGRCWHLHRIDIDPAYACHLASETEDVPVLQWL